MLTPGKEGMTTKRRGRPPKNATNRKENKPGPLLKHLIKQTDQKSESQVTSEDPFEKSSIIMRSPNGKERKEREEEVSKKCSEERVGCGFEEREATWDEIIMEKVEQLFTERNKMLLDEINQLKNTMQRNEAESREEILTLKNRVRELEERQEHGHQEEPEVATQEQVTQWIDVKKRVEKLEEGGHETAQRKVSEIELRLERKERRERRNNVIIRGVQLQGQTLREGVERFFVEQLDINERAVTVEKLIRKGGDVVKDDILVKLDSLEAKKNIMTRKKQLKGTNIYIDDDWTKTEKEIQRRIREAARNEEEKGNRVRTGYMKIAVNGKWSKWNETEGRFENQVFQEERRRETHPQT